MRIYLDTNAFIPAVEGSGPLRNAMESLLSIGDVRTGILVTSEITLAEVLISPLEKGQSTVATAYMELIDPRPGLEVVPVNRNVLILAAHIRSTNKTLRLPDAIHLATAELAGCSQFLSSDRSLKGSDKMERIPVAVQDIEQLIGKLT